MVAYLTGGNLGRAVIIAVVFFVLATAWSWSRWRNRLAEQAARRPGGTRR